MMKFYKTMKTYFAQKKELRELSLDTLRKANSIAGTVKTLTESLADSTGSVSPDELKALMENMDKLVNDPALTTEYFKQLNQNAHEERMAELSDAR